MNQLDLFYNTVPLKGQELKEARSRMARQEEKILAIFKKHRYTSLTPVDVHRYMGGNSVCPITSVRRAITNLTTHGKLVMTGEKRMGLYGMVNNCWKLKF